MSSFTIRGNAYSTGFTTGSYSSRGAAAPYSYVPAMPAATPVSYTPQSATRVAQPFTSTASFLSSPVAAPITATPSYATPVMASQSFQSANYQSGTYPSAAVGTYQSASVVAGAPLTGFASIGGARPLIASESFASGLPVASGPSRIISSAAPAGVSYSSVAMGASMAGVYGRAPMEARVISGGIAGVAYQEFAPISEMVATTYAPTTFVETVQQQPVYEVVQQQQQQQVVETYQQQEVETVQQPVEMVQEQQPGPPRILIVCTSTDRLGDMPTGAWSEEVTAPFYTFRDAGCEVYICSVNGGPVPIDQNSLAEGAFTEFDKRFLEEGGQQLLDEAPALSQFPIEDIDCVWLAGGHGTCMDFEAGLAQYVTDAVIFGRPVGAVCHGVIGLLSAINQDSTPLLAGREVTGFSNAEEEQVGLAGVVPFLVQDRMQELGAKYSCAEPWAEYALTDGQITTGQNPQSSMLAAQLCVQAMMPPQ